MNHFIAVVLVVSVSLSHCSKVEQDLIQKLLTGYDLRARPSAGPTDAVPVTMDVYLLKMSNINEDKGEAHMGFWVGMSWNDSRLTWDSSNYKSLHKINLLSQWIWTPDITVNTGNTVVEKLLGSSQYDVSVKSNGEVSYSYPINQIIPCVHTADKGGLQCSVAIESWAMSIGQLTLKAGTPKPDTSLLGAYYDKRYKVKDSAYDAKQISYPDAPEDKYDNIKARFFLEKQK